MSRNTILKWLQCKISNPNCTCSLIYHSYSKNTNGLQWNLVHRSSNVTKKGVWQTRSSSWPFIQKHGFYNVFQFLLTIERISNGIWYIASFYSWGRLLPERLKTSLVLITVLLITVRCFSCFPGFTFQYLDRPLNASWAYLFVGRVFYYFEEYFMWKLKSMMSRVIFTTSVTVTTLHYKTVT